MNRLNLATSFLSSLLILCGSLAADSVHAAPRRRPASTPNPTVILRQSLQNEAAKLGTLSSWQKRVLDEEVLAQPQSFVLQERTQSDGTSQYDFDIETVQRLLSMGCGDAPARCGAWVYVRTAAKCPSCDEKIPAVEKQVESLLIRRGFKPAAISAAKASAELARARASLSPTEVSLEPSEWESERAWQQALAISAASISAPVTSAAPSADSADRVPPRAIVLVSLQELQDTSHASPDAPAEEAGRPAVRLALAYRESAGNSANVTDWNWSVSRWTGVRAGDSVLGPVGKLLGDTVSDLVVRLDLGLRGVAASTASSQVSSGAPLGGFSVRILGIRNFQQYSRARNVISAALQSAGFAEPLEQAVKRGEVVWRIFPEKSGVGEPALLATLRGVKPGDSSLGERPNLRVLDAGNSADRDRIEALEIAFGGSADEAHPLFKDATVTVELPGEEHKR